MTTLRCSIIFVLLVLSLLPAQSQASPTLDLDDMTLEQKVGQMFVMSFFGSELNMPARDLLITWQPGAIVFLPSNLENPAQITRLTNDIQQSLVDSGSIPAFISVDQEGGLIAHLEEGFTTWAVPSLLTATQNPELAYDFGQALATELRAVGINMNLAPVADLQTNLANQVIGRRSFGNDPELVSPIISAVIQGMQDNAVLATIKHFPGHGDTLADSHLELPTLNLSADDLLARELRPFVDAIQVDVGAVMVAHIHFPLIDESVIPASLSTNIISGLLRDNLTYDGLVITDALDMDAIDTVYSPSESAIRAIEAGNDLILLGAHISPENQAEAMQAVVDAVRNGDISEDRINTSVDRILRAKERFDVLNWSPLDPNQAEVRINSEAHTELVNQMFQQGITLVHDDTSLLPLPQRTLMIYPATRSTLGLACNRNDWQFLSVSRNPTETDIATASQVSQFVDAVVVITENASDNTAQQRLVSQLPSDKTLIVAIWSPFDALVLPDISAYMVTYSPLAQAYEPLCDILHNEASAEGTLSVMLEAE
ncbi:MAG: glycoside hydrolase family 3 protein [Chloroflexota bacterium]